MAKPGEEYARVLSLLKEKALLARQQGHWVEAPMLDRILALLSTAQNFEQNVEAACELISWLPFAPELENMDHEVRTAWLTGLVFEADLERSVKHEVIRILNPKPGRPHSTQRFAVRAVELHEKGESWTPVVRRLPCDWTMVESPENSIRRQVQLLEQVLRKYGIHAG